MAPELIYPGTQAVMRAISLLKAFSPTKTEMSLTELARQTGLNKPTAYRLLSALQSQGMVERNPSTDAYRLGSEMLVLGGLALRSNDLSKVARTELEALAHASRETATMEICIGDQVLILDEVLGDHLLGIAPSVGTRWPIHATSTGKALLAQLPAQERLAALPSPLPAYTEHTLTDPARLETELEAIHRQGYAMAIEELEAGFVAVAAPIFDDQGRAVAAISLGGPSQRLTPERRQELAAMTLEAARSISVRLGLRHSTNC